MILVGCKWALWFHYIKGPKRVKDEKSLNRLEKLRVGSRLKLIGWVSCCTSYALVCTLHAAILHIAHPTGSYASPLH